MTTPHIQQTRFISTAIAFYDYSSILRIISISFPWVRFLIERIFNQNVILVGGRNCNGFSEILIKRKRILDQTYLYIAITYYTLYAYTRNNAYTP